MIEPMGHNPPPLADGVSMVTMQGRDEAWAGRSMAALFARATELNLMPLRWELGFFVLRDLVAARDPGFRQRRDWKRPATMWGCDVKVVGFEDQVTLVSRGTIVGHAGEIHRLTAKG